MNMHSHTDDALGAITVGRLKQGWGPNWCETIEELQVAQAEEAEARLWKPYTVVTGHGEVDFEILKKATRCTWGWAATSPEARLMVDDLTRLLLNWEERTKHRTNARGNAQLARLRAAAEAFVGDLLAAADQDDSDGWMGCSTAADSFTGTPVTYAHFSSVRAALTGLDMIETARGMQRVNRSSSGLACASPLVSKGLTTRFKLRSDALHFIEGFGITPANRRKHFRLGLPPKPLVLKAASVYVEDRKQSPVGMKFKSTPHTDALKAQVQSINEFIGRFEIRGADHWAFNRIFTEGDKPDFGWNKGGRLVSIVTQLTTYQGEPKAVRLAMTIDGESVDEVDVSSSHLVILHGLCGEPVDLSQDLYEFDGIARSAVKCWATVTLGLGKHFTAWPLRTLQKYHKEYGADLRSLYSVASIRTAMVDRFPILESPEKLRITWADLQFHESCAIIDTMERLMAEGVPSLPVHDSLIVRSRDAEKAVSNLKQSYLKFCHIVPIIKNKTSVSPSS